MKIDARKLVHDFGGQAELRRKLEASGNAVSASEKYARDTIEKWCQRKSIPGRWLVIMNSIMKFDIANYVIKQAPTRKKKA